MGDCVAARCMSLGKWEAKSSGGWSGASGWNSPSGPGEPGRMSSPMMRANTSWMSFVDGWSGPRCFM